MDDNIVAQVFIDGLRRFVNHKINSIDIILKADTHITFGGKTFCEPEFRQKIKTFIRNFEDSSHETAKDYYDILEDMRNEIAFDVDKEKFKSLNLTRKEDLVFFRNMIYSQLINYKLSTNKLLKEVVLVLDSLTIEQELKTEYGINDRAFSLLEELKKEVFSSIS